MFKCSESLKKRVYEFMIDFHVQQFVNIWNFRWPSLIKKNCYHSYLFLACKKDYNNNNFQTNKVNLNVMAGD